MAIRMTWKSRSLTASTSNNRVKYFHGAPIERLDLNGVADNTGDSFRGIAAGGRAGQGGAVSTRPHRQAVRRTLEVSVLRYDSLIDLREQLEQFDSPASGDVTCVLAVEPSFAGHVPSLVRQRNVASQLVLTTTGGPCPALDIEELLASSQPFGWRSFSVEKDGEKAMRDAVESPSRRRVVLCWPSWVEMPVASATCFSESR